MKSLKAIAQGWARKIVNEADPELLPPSLRVAKLNAAMFKAASSGDEAQLSAALAAGADPKHAFPKDGANGSTALIAAACAGRDGCVRLLLQASDPAAQDANGRDALMNAAALGRASCVAALLCSDKTDPWAVSTGASGGLTALQYAAAGGHADCVRLLLPVSNFNQRSPNHPDVQALAAAMGKQEVVEAIQAYKLSIFEEAALSGKIPGQASEAVPEPAPGAPSRKSRL